MLFYFETLNTTVVATSASSVPKRTTTSRTVGFGRFPRRDEAHRAGRGEDGWKEGFVAEVDKSGMVLRVHDKVDGAKGLSSESAKRGGQEACARR
jgi:hypothetical protein